MKPSTLPSTSTSPPQHKPYHRYHIETKKTPNIVPHPYRFCVDVNKFKLAKLLVKELVHYKGNLEVVKSRPCVYGVFSGPVGGFAPREHLCVGCLRCTTQYPDMVTVSHNPARQLIGDDFFTPDHVDTVVHESETGRIPIKGQGYRGKFGGEGWDGMWTDMSEIVRPTRDGIHGREFISTEIDIGDRPAYLQFDQHYQPLGPIPQMVSIPIPILLDTLPTSTLSRTTCHILSDAAHVLKTFVILPFRKVMMYDLNGSHIVPLLDPNDFSSFKNFTTKSQLIELSSWNLQIFQEIRNLFPNVIPILRIDFDTDNDLLALFHAGVRVFHFTADYHGRSKNGKFVLDLIREAHQVFVNAKCRDQVTLIGSGGIIVAEHVPKAIICGLDAVALDTALLVALQARFDGPCINQKDSHFVLPSNLTHDWGKQRIINLAGSWRDQLFEILGAMGLREVRRMRGEVGRAMFQKNLEEEAFSGISGYESR